MFLTLGNISEEISPKEYPGISPKESLECVYAALERNQMKEEIIDDTEARMAFLELEMCFVRFVRVRLKWGLKNDLYRNF